MHYVIYPDTLFLENFIVNLIFLFFLKSRFFHAVKGRKIVQAALMTAVCNTLTSILFFKWIWVIQTGVLFPASGIIVCYCFEIKDRRRILYLLYQMMLWILVLGGILQSLEQWKVIPVQTMLLAVSCFAIFFGCFEKLFKGYKKHHECMREIVLYWGGKCRHFQGFADTGNQLIDPFTQKPVSIISKDAWEQLLEGSLDPHYHLIPYQTVGTERGLIPGAQIDYMVILEGNKSQIVERPVIAITEQSFEGIFHYSVLLHNDYC